jgi:hypothetical protein
MHHQRNDTHALPSLVFWLPFVSLFTFIWFVLQGCAQYSWITGVWGACTSACTPAGSTPGSQTRSVECKQDGTTAVVADSQCTATRPISIQTCGSQVCPPDHVWQTGAPSECSAVSVSI